MLQHPEQQANYAEMLNTIKSLWIWGHSETEARSDINQAVVAGFNHCFKTPAIASRRLIWASESLVLGDYSTGLVHSKLVGENLQRTFLANLNISGS